MTRNPKPVETWLGTFPSMTAAAEAHGVTVATISKARRDNRLHLLGRARRPQTGYRVTVDGDTFPSICAAHRATGIDRRKLMAMAMEGKR